MKKSELQNYIKKFRNDGEVALVIVDAMSRKLYPVHNTICVTDMGDPVIIIDVGHPENMDTENIDHTDLSDQMSFDFSEKSEDQSAQGWRDHISQRFDRIE